MQLIGFVAYAGERHRLRGRRRSVGDEQSATGFESDAFDHDGITDPGEDDADLTHRGRAADPRERRARDDRRADRLGATLREQVLLRLLAGEHPRGVGTAMHRARVPPAVLVVLVDRTGVVEAAPRATVTEDPDVAELVQRARDDTGPALRTPDQEHGRTRRLAHDI